jgi:hypothetical protein
MFMYTFSLSLSFFFFCLELPILWLPRILAFPPGTLYIDVEGRKYQFLLHDVASLSISIKTSRVQLKGAEKLRARISHTKTRKKLHAKMCQETFNM